ncbi:MAG: hypothetical protein AAB685_00590 [Patescibacteria group bacterium]
MESLAKLFVGLVAIGNVFFPKANLPQVLGIRDEIKQGQKENREEVSQKREEFRNKLKTLKDEKKKLIVEKIDQKYDLVNKKWVEKWNKGLVRLTDILAKIKQRDREGKLRQVISNAEAKIAAAQAKVDEQALETYVIDISSEDKLGPSVRATNQQFKNDIKAVHELVKEARKAVVEVINQAKSLNRGGGVNE